MAFINTIAVSLFLLQLSFACNPAFYFNIEKKLFWHISFSSACFCYYRKHPNNDNKISSQLACFQQRFQDWFFVRRFTIRIWQNLNEHYCYLTSIKSAIWQIDTNRSPFQLLNMLPFHILRNTRTLKTNLLQFIIIFSKYYFKIGTIFHLFLSSYLFTA